MVKLEDIISYQIANELSDCVWEAVSSWDIFSKKTCGEQFVRSIDSIAANIAEAHGRYFKKVKMKFLYYARGSVFEAQFWAKKSLDRHLLTKEEFEDIMERLRKLPKEINYLIKWTNENLNI